MRVNFVGELYPRFVVKSRNKGLGFGGFIGFIRKMDLSVNKRLPGLTDDFSGTMPRCGEKRGRPCYPRDSTDGGWSLKFNGAKYWIQVKLYS